MQNKWTISLDGLKYHGIYESYSEALNSGLKYHDSDFYISRCYEFDPTVDLSYHAIDKVQSKAEQECGESAEDFLWRLTDNDYRELDRQLSEVLVKFVNEHKDKTIYSLEGNPVHVERSEDE